MYEAHVTYNIYIYLFICMYMYIIYIYIYTYIYIYIYAYMATWASEADLYLCMHLLCTKNKHSAQRVFPGWGCHHFSRRRRVRAQQSRLETCSSVEVIRLTNSYISPKRLLIAQGKYVDLVLIQIAETSKIPTCR